MLMQFLCVIVLALLISTWCKRYGVPSTKPMLASLGLLVVAILLLGALPAMKVRRDSDFAKWMLVNLAIGMGLTAAIGFGVLRWIRANATQDPPAAASGPAAPGARPTVVTVLVVLMVLGVILLIPSLVTSWEWLPGWLIAVNAVAAAVGLYCAWGLWRMKRRAVDVYTSMVAVTQLLLLVSGHWNVASLLIPVVVVILMWRYRPVMS
jgi:chromate transport protein ChrA